MTEPQKALLKKLCAATTLSIEDLSPEERDLVHYLCSHSFAFRRFEPRDEITILEEGKSKLADILHSEQIELQNKSEARKTSFQSWLAIILSLLALLSSWKEEIISILQKAML